MLIKWSCRRGTQGWSCLLRRGDREWRVDSSTIDGCGCVEDLKVHMIQVIELPLLVIEDQIRNLIRGLILR